MEDTHAHGEFTAGDLTIVYYAIYDGHAGDHCSIYLAEPSRLHDGTQQPLSQPSLYEQLRENICGEDGTPTGTPSIQDIKNACSKACRDVDTSFLRWAKERDSQGGSCAIGCLVITDKSKDGQRTILTMNVGDSRALVVKTDGKVVALSEDHKPDVQRERERITQLGGKVIWGRVEGMLAVSRAFGDSFFKREGRMLVIAEPEFKTHTVSKNDHVLLISCDGLFEKLTNVQVGRHTRDALKEFAGTHDRGKRMQNVAHKVLDHGYNSGSGDNISIMCIALNT